MIFLSIGYSSKAQKANQLYFTNSLGQATQYNPAAKTKYKVSISFPGFGGLNYAANNSTFNFNSIFTKNQNGKYALDVNKLLEASQGQNKIYSNLDYEMFGVYINTKKLSINVAIREHVNSTVTLPYDLIGLPLKGIAHKDYLDKKVNISPEFTTTHYRTFSVGGSYKVTDKLNVGLNFKTIFGIGALKTTEGSEFTIREAANTLGYEAHSNLKINTSGTAWLLDKDQDIDLKNYLVNFDNMTYAIDLGITYNLTKKWSLQASALNIGPKLKWESELTSFSLSPTEKKLSFSGIDPLSDDKSLSVDKVTDFFKDISKVEKNADEVEKIETQLPMQFYAGTKYAFTKSFYVSTLVGFTVLENQTFSSLGFSTQKEFGEFLGLGVSYLWDYSGHNFGSLLSLGFPGFKFYVSSESALSSILNWKEAKAIDFRAGINLNFGRLYRKSRTDLQPGKPRYRFKNRYPKFKLEKYKKKKWKKRNKKA